MYCDDKGKGFKSFKPSAASAETIEANAGDVYARRADASEDSAANTENIGNARQTGTGSERTTGINQNTPEKEDFRPFGPGGSLTASGGKLTNTIKKMKASKIIDFIKVSGIDNSQFDTFKMYEETHDGKVAFVEHYFGGDFVAGALNTGSDYVAFWDDAPQGVADAIVTDGEGHKIKVFEIE